MLLLDRNNDPVKTVYYIATLAYLRISTEGESGIIDLYRWICDPTRCGEVPYDFFLMAIDFLFLVAGVNVTGEGMLHVRKVG